MTLLSADEPVFVIDLSEAALAEARSDFEEPLGPARGRPRDLSAPERPVRAVALLLGASEDPLLLEIEPTRDAVMLDALARLVRAALVTGETVASLATEHGGEALRRLYLERRFPRFVYEGVPPPAGDRLPRGLARALVVPRRGEPAPSAPAEAPGCRRLYFRIDVREIAFVRFVVESYEGIAVVTSYPRRGEMEWVVPEGCLAEAVRLASALASEVGLVPIERPDDWP
jgi:hypothetical protein